jgi:hypothetical protein
MKFFFLAATILLNSAFCANASAAAADNPVIARGKGFEIRHSALDQVLATAKAQHPHDELPPDADIHALIHLIEIQLVFNRATDVEKAEGAKNADERLAAIVQSLGKPEMDRRLEPTHMASADLRLMLAQEMTAQSSLTRQLGIVVTDADAQKYFATHPGAFDRPAMAHVRELVLLTTSDFSNSAAPPLPADALQAKRKLADELLKRVRAGEDFAALAKQFNEDPMSRDSAGEITFIKEQMEFGGLAFSMKPGQVSDVLANNDGYRIFQLLDIIPASKAEFAATADRIKNGLIGEEKRRLAPAYITKLRNESAVEIMDPQLKAALAANDAEIAANARRAAEADATAAAIAASPTQKAAEAQAFGAAATQPATKP